MIETTEQEKPLNITITLPTHAYFISGIRNFTLEMVKNVTHFSEQWAFRFQSVIDELCNNAIEYGSAPGADIKITFTARKNEFLEIIVEDSGTGKGKMTPEEISNMVKERSTMNPSDIQSIRGRGLPQIVFNWSDVLEFSKSPLGGIKVRMVKHLTKDAGDTSKPVYGYQL